MKALVIAALLASNAAFADPCRIVASAPKRSAWPPKSLSGYDYRRSDDIEPHLPIALPFAGSDEARKEDRIVEPSDLEHSFVRPTDARLVVTSSHHVLVVGTDAART